MQLLLIFWLCGAVIYYGLLVWRCDLFSWMRRRYEYLIFVPLALIWPMTAITIAVRVVLHFFTKHWKSHVRSLAEKQDGSAARCSFSTLARSEPRRLLSLVVNGTLADHDLTFAVEALGLVDDECLLMAVEVLAVLARHDSPVVREGVVYGLARLLMRERRAGEALKQLTSDPNPEVRTAAVEALEPSQEALDAILARALEAPDRPEDQPVFSVHRNILLGARVINQLDTGGELVSLIGENGSLVELGAVVRNRRVGSFDVRLISLEEADETWQIVVTRGDERGAVVLTYGSGSVLAREVATRYAEEATEVDLTSDFDPEAHSFGERRVMQASRK